MPRRKPVRGRAKARPFSWSQQDMAPAEAPLKPRRGRPAKALVVAESQPVQIEPEEINTEGLSMPEPVTPPTQPQPVKVVKVKIIRDYWCMNGERRRAGDVHALPVMEALKIMNAGIAERADELTVEDL